MSGHRVATGLLLGLLVVGTVACGDEKSSTAEVANPDGKTYVMSQSTGLDVPEGATLQLAFQDGAIAVSGGCNSMNGSYTVTNSKLVVEHMASTSKACDDALMQYDTDVTAFLTSSPGIVIAGDVMTLQNSDITMTLQQAPVVADSPLEGTTWTVTGTVQGDATQSLQTDPATLVMKDGTAEVFAGCNSGSAKYTIDGTSITWEPLVLTRKACGPEATQLEETVTVVLQGTTTYDITGTKLVLTQGTQGLTLTAS
jgi:heat shock protein HslJ